MTRLMEGPRNDANLQFMINGRIYHVSRDNVTERLKGVKPRDIRKYYTVIAGEAYPVKQAYAIGFALPRGEVITSQRAAASLERLGFTVDEVQDTEPYRLADRAPRPADVPTLEVQDRIIAAAEPFVVNTFTPDGEPWQLLFEADGTGHYGFSHAARFQPSGPVPMPVVALVPDAARPTNNGEENKMAVFRLQLQPTYYQKGFFNVSVDYDRYVRRDEGLIDVQLGDNEADTIPGRIDRHSNPNRTARIICGASLRDWFQENFVLMEYVYVDLTLGMRLILRKSPGAK